MGPPALAVLAALLALVALRFTRRATVAQDELVNERAPVVAAALSGIAAATLLARHLERSERERAHTCPKFGSTAVRQVISRLWTSRRSSSF